MTTDAHDHGELRYVAPGMEPAVFAARADVVFAPPAPAGQVQEQVKAFLRHLQGRLAAVGCVLVGHVKGTLETAERGSLSFSVTSLGGDARVAATLGDDICAAVLTINAIVFGVTEAAARAAVLNSWPATVAAPTRWR